MTTEVIKWVTDFLVGVLRQSLELLLRVILFFLPLGFYLTLLEFRSKVSSTSNLSVYTNDKSTWQHVFPGFILVAIDSSLFKKTLKSINESFQQWIKQNKYTLAFIACMVLILITVAILLLK